MATAVAACALMAPFASCGDDDSDATADETTTSTSETTIASTTTTQDPEAEVEAAYLAYWEMAQRLGQDPQPNDPEISERATGDAHDQAVDAFATLRAQGRRIQFGDQYGHNVVSIDLGDGTATVRDCNVDDAATIDTATDQSISASITTNLLEATLLFESGTWRVGSISKVDAWQGATRCAA